MNSNNNIYNSCKKGNGMFLHYVHISGHYSRVCGNCHQRGCSSEYSIQNIDRDTRLDCNKKLESVEQTASSLRYEFRNCSNCRYQA